MKVLLVTTLALTTGEIFGQREIERTNSMWGKLALEQVSPDKILSGETIAINYRAFDVRDVSIGVCKNGKIIRLYDDLYSGVGQIKIREELSPGKYEYVLLINGRLVEKRKFEIISAIAKN